MPTLNLYTNIPVDTVVAADILKDASKAVSKIIGKPESYVMILLNGGTPIVFAGTEEPAAYGELISIGGLGPSVNGKLSSTIAEILQTKIDIDSSRFYIKFYDAEYVMILLNGGTPIVFAGTEESSAYGEMIAIGGLGPSVNGKLSSTIAEILQTKLHIDSSRFYIKFYDVQASYVGYNGSTF